MDIRVEKLADLLVNYSVKVRKKDKVVIVGSHLAMPLLKAIYERTLQAGGFPLVMTQEAEFDEILFRRGTRDQIEYIHDVSRNIAEKYDVRIVILGGENTRSLTHADPDGMVWYSRARTGLVKTMMQRTAAGEFRWVVAPFPTNAMAQDADMSISEYEDFLYHACMPDLNDPVGYWQSVSAEHARIINWLWSKKTVHITGTETDLTLSIAGRRFENCDGRLNMPDGEIFTGPDEDSAEGHVYFSYPAIESGHEVTGIRLWFEKGKVVKASAEKNEEFLLKTLDTDPGARYIGEFAIGTNSGIKQFTREILFDEKIGGSFHLALGAGYPETGSKNESAIHWDMVCDLRSGGEIRVDGELFYQNGQFII